MKRWLAAGLMALGANAVAAPFNLQQDFNNLATSGWSIFNNSTPGGSTSWFQGNAGVFGAQAGAANAYAAANFLSIPPQGGTISTWLVSPEIEFASQVLTFFSRTEGGPAGGFGDGLRVLACTSGACSVPADFSEVLGINTANAAAGFPQDWTQFVAQLAAGGTGRIAFEYTVGPRALANFIGIDTVRVFVAVPEPGSLALFAAGVLGALLLRRRSGAVALAAAGLVAAGAAGAQGGASGPNGVMTFPNVRVMGAPGTHVLPGDAPTEGFRAYKDVETGEFAAPSIEDASALSDALPAEMKKPPRKALSVTRHPNGTIEMRLGRQSLNYAVVRRDATGVVARACVQGEDLARALVESSAASSGGAQ
jgi:hypothetical protein